MERTRLGGRVQSKYTLSIPCEKMQILNTSSKHDVIVDPITHPTNYGILNKYYPRELPCIEQMYIENSCREQKNSGATEPNHFGKFTVEYKSIIIIIIIDRSLCSYQVERRQLNNEKLKNGLEVNRGGVAHSYQKIFSVPIALK